MKKSFAIAGILAATLLSTGCSSIKGTVYKQTDGSYKATYASSTERDVRKVIHSDAAITCKKKTDDENFLVLKEEVVKTEDDSKKEGFAAVADSAVSLVGKYMGAESVRGSLVFNCGA